MKSMWVLISFLWISTAMLAQPFKLLWNCRLPENCQHLGLTPDERFVIAACNNDSTYFVNASNGDIHWRLFGGSSFGVTEDGVYLYHFDSQEGTFVKVDIASGEKLFIMQRDNKLNELEFSAVSKDCHYGAAVYGLSAASSSYGWRVWDLTNGKIIQDHMYVTSPKHLLDAHANRLHFMCQEKVVVVEEDKGYYKNDNSEVYTHNYVAYNIDTGDSVESFEDNLHFFSITGDCAKYAITTSSHDTDGMIVYDRLTHAESVRMQVPGASINGDVVFSSNNQYAIVPSVDSLLFICRMSDGKKVYCPGSGGCNRLCVNSNLSFIPICGGSMLGGLVPSLPFGEVSIEPDSTMYLFPNPTTGVVGLKLTDGCPSLETVSATNVCGISYSLKSTCVDSTTMRIETSALDPGVYIINVASPKIYYRCKLMINK